MKKMQNGKWKRAKAASAFVSVTWEEVQQG
jgi:hypothetical protein